MHWSGQATFFVLAALVQAGLGVAILVRRARVEWALVLGTLFLGNGALAVNALLVETGWGGWTTGLGSRVFFVFDRLTTVLVAYLALAYPRRPRWAQRPWILPLLLGVVLATLLPTGLLDQLGVRAHHVVPPGLEPADCQAPCMYTGAWYYWAYQTVNVGFLVLLVRWARLLPQVGSPIDLGQFRLLFAAFAVRGIHIELLIYRNGPLPLLLGTDPLAGVDPLYWYMHLRATVSLALVALAAVLLLRARRHAPSDRRRAIDFVLAFFLIGALLTLLVPSSRLVPGFSGILRDYYFGPFLNLDVLVLRPALIVYAMLRYDFLGSWTQRRGLVLAFVGALAGVGYASGLLPALVDVTGSSPIAWGIAVPLAAGLGLATGLVLQGYVGPPRNTAVQNYVALLEDAYRNGTPPQSTLDDIERRRRRWGIEDAEAQALQAAVAGRWKGDGLWLPGQRVGRYELRRLLGAGGWGETYLADDLLDGREVVLKRTKSLTAVERKALLAEAYTLTKLAHPHIVPLVRTDVIGEEPVVVLERMPGGSLASRLQALPGHALTASEARRLATGVLSALAAVHAAGIVHGDVKPGNILYDADGNARLGDFGLARPALPSPARLGDPTPSPRSSGTVRYLAPEQARGQPATAASDLFSAGVVLLEALSGGHPVLSTVPEYEQRRRIAEDPFPVPARLGPWRPLLSALLDPDPRRRPTASAALALLP